MQDLIYTTNPLWLLLIAALVGAQIGAALSIIKMSGGQFGRSARQKREAEFLQQERKAAEKNRLQA